MSTAEEVRKKELVALIESIAHWERMKETPDPRSCEEEPTSHHCACCIAYENTPCTDEEDNLCPIAQVTGRTSCKNTPYYRANAAWKSWLCTLVAGCPDPRLVEYARKLWKEEATNMINCMKEIKENLERKEI